MLDIHSLRVFLEAAKYENFTEAGRVLSLTQPAVSAQIKSLEGYLNVSLFERAGRNIRLTKAGQALVPRAERLLHMAIDVEESVRATDGRVVGNLVIGASASSARYVLSHLIARFKRLYPEVRIAVPIMPEEIVMDKLAQGEYDVGIVHETAPGPDFSTFEMYTDQLVLIAPSTHPWGTGEPIDPHRLSEESFICQVSDSHCRQVVSQALNSVGMTPQDLQIKMEIDSPEALAAAAEHGLGISFIPKVVAVPRLSLGRLAIVPIEGLTITYPVNILHSNKHSISNPLAKFLAFTRMEQSRTLIDMIAQGHIL